MDSRERCMACITGRPVDRTPVFPLLMFFAQQRAGISYREYATNGRALADAQLGILDRFPVDAITACSDAFRVAADLGADMAYPEDKPPFATRALVTNEQRQPESRCGLAPVNARAVRGALRRNYPEGERLAVYAECGVRGASRYT